MAAGESSPPPPGPPKYLGPSEDDIRQQLKRILASPQFVNSLNLQKFLRFIVEKALSGEAAKIKGYTVATQVLGRKTFRGVRQVFCIAGCNGT